eukprot:symbB.v1.2.010809.t1/scaffold712.1/size170421/8
MRRMNQTCRSAWPRLWPKARPRAWNSCTICRMPTSRHRTHGGGFSGKTVDTDLFVAKLNPVTQDGDLELIFSRFGPIKSCEIVRDWKTGDSLQYAFIIYENPRDCEQAYFKMHDCVIDDRRIFVNFSQSVAKLWNKWRTGSRMTKEDVKGGAETKGGGRGKGKGKGKSKDKDQAPLLSAAEGPKVGGKKPGPFEYGKEDREGRDRRNGRDERDGRNGVYAWEFRKLHLQVSLCVYRRHRRGSPPAVLCLSPPHLPDVAGVPADARPSVFKGRPSTAMWQGACGPEACSSFWERGAGYQPSTVVLVSKKIQILQLHVLLRICHGTFPEVPRKEEGCSKYKLQEDSGGG